MLSIRAVREKQNKLKSEEEEKFSQYTIVRLSCESFLELGFHGESNYFWGTRNFALISSLLLILSHLLKNWKKIFVLRIVFSSSCSSSSFSNKLLGGQANNCPNYCRVVFFVLFCFVVVLLLFYYICADRGRRALLCCVVLFNESE